MFLREKVAFIAIISLLITSCGNDKLDIDVSDIQLETMQVRVDLQLNKGREGGENQLRNTHAKLIKQFPYIYKEYYQGILQLGDPLQPQAYESLLLFLNDPLMSEVQDQIVKSFPDSILFKKDVDDAFKHYKHYFPFDTIPAIAFYNSGFNYGIYPTPNFVGVGLEWYIGNDNPLLNRLPPAQFPKYLREKMRPEYIVSDILRGYLLVKYSDKIDGKEFVNQIVYFGKIAYLMDACMPKTAAYLKYGYRPSQEEWCRENEFLIWKTLVKEDMLFSKDRKLINSFIGNAPFTKGFSDESPGKIAFFIGKMMVVDYMNENEDVQVSELLNVPTTKILKSYRPKK